MSVYAVRRTNLCRDIDDGATKKQKCSWRDEFFHLTAEGLLTSINEYEDGFIYQSPLAQLPMPAGVQPIGQGQYMAALGRYNADRAKKEAATEKERAFQKQLRSGDIYGLKSENKSSNPLT